MNTPKIAQYTKKVPIIELFGPVLQGEGAMIGVQTWFIRLGGCDYECKWCDSLHAVLPDQVHKNADWMTQTELANSLLEKGSQSKAKKIEWITLSGGNPAIWDLTEFMHRIQSEGIKVAIETQGTVYRSYIARCDQVTISPKGPGMIDKFEHGLEQLAKFVEHLEIDRKALNLKGNICLKVPVFGSEDLEFVKQLTRLYNYPMFISLGNTWIDNPRNTSPRTSYSWEAHTTSLLSTFNEVSEHIMRDPELVNVRILPQMHVLQYGNQRLK